MWPWEHVFFAYVLFSLYVHGRHRERPTDAAVVVLAFGAVLPDLIDKPLAWQFGLFETGYAVAHSVFVVVPALFGLALLARRRGSETLTVAFTVGYLLHLVGDVLPASLSRRTVDLSPVLWPVSNRPPIDAGGTFAESTLTLLVRYVAQLLTLELTLVVALQLGSVLVGTVLWLSDGSPGLRVLTSPLRWLREV
ncbi:metal-dependent hydrolase [Halobellus limi]|uniref:Hydrolase n=1 Tax=Halobellus limi TaxID=699433 RepID=A0A1H6BD99_9EURY|nr:metal-dependent hydrolase [Halobellus limi]QCC49267.1 hydrolase [Halobellus limi]SEG58325.1 LexA-binding, inner membrane-associated putative hydrolase [Halobellus limi]